MTGAKVRVVGLDTLDRTLHKAADDFGKHPDMNARQARALAAGMRERAPRRTGRLAASIQPDSGDDYAAAGTGLRYGAVQEYGSPPRHLRAQPFARPTLAAQGDDYQRELSKEIQGDLDRVKGA